MGSSARGGVGGLTDVAAPVQHRWVMHPDQMYMLAKLRMAETEAQARDERRVPRRQPRPLWQVLGTRMRLAPARGRRQDQPLANTKHPRLAEMR